MRKVSILCCHRNRSTNCHGAHQMLAFEDQVLDDIQEHISSLECIINRFVNSQDVRESSKRTYRRQLEQFLRHMSLKKYAFSNGNISRQDIIEYRNSLTESGKTISTVNGYMTAVSIFFRWAEDQGLFGNPNKGIRNIRPTRGFRKDCLTLGQVREVLSSFDTSTEEGMRDYALFNLMVRTGVRAVEVSRARVEDIKQEHGQAILWIQGKGRDSKDAFVLLVDECLSSLRRYLSFRGSVNGDEALFVVKSNRNKGKSLTERTISYIIKEILKKININDRRITAHSLRHTAISLSVAGGASLVQAQAMARHVDPKTTMIYFHNHDRIISGAERFIRI